MEVQNVKRKRKFEESGDDSSFGSDSDSGIKSDEFDGRDERSTSSILLNPFTNLKVINDPVHKSIELPELFVRVMDTPEFQRLRGLTQCGPCSRVYPAAVHTRFEHCLGVSHLAMKVIDFLRRSHDISDEDKLCVGLAGLCHDLGHGPFSHMWERFVAQQNQLYHRNQPWHHEKTSSDIFDRLVEANNLRPYFARFGLFENEINFVKQLISGHGNVSKERQFLFEIVANSETGVDVDRWEYMLRDSMYFGFTITVDVNRIMPAMAVKRDENGFSRIAYRDKIANGLLEMFQTRGRMHLHCYQHRVAKILETMYLDVLALADGEGVIIPNMRLSQCHEDLDKYLSLTDHIFPLIQYSTCPKLHESKLILERIARRDLYTEIGIFHLNQERIKQLAKNRKVDFTNEITKLSTDLVNNLKMCFPQFEFRLSQIKFEIGHNQADPIAGIPFYSKSQPDKLFWTSIEKLDSFYTPWTNFAALKLLVACTEKPPSETLIEMKRTVKDYLSDYN